MTLKKFNLFILKTILVVFVLFYRFYSSDAVEGFVYDAETNQPLEGVEVEIYWSLDYGVMLHMTRVIENFKTKTDKNGYFYFPAWGPSINKRRDVSKGPSLIVYKKNYTKEHFNHSQYYHTLFASWIIIGDPPWYNRGEKTIRLKKLKPNVKK